MRHFRLICVMTILTLLSGICFADDLQLETITVTAEKRAADSQEVAVPMNVMTETFVQDRDIKSIDQMGRYIPNIVIDTNWGINQSWVVFRGMSSNEFLATSPVVLNVDGLPSDASYGFNTTFEDIERIEVLRGPQGTLYGKNAMSGAVNVITKKPGNEYTGFVGFSGEERSGYGLNASVSGPIVKDRYFFGLSGGYRQTDGYIHDTTPGGKDHLDGWEKYNYTMKFRATPTASSDILLKYQRNSASGANPAAVASDSHTYDMYTGYKDEALGDTKSTTDSLLLNMEFSTKAVNITSITSYKNVDTDEVMLMGQQMGVIAAGGQVFTAPTITQELRFASPETSKIKWLAGLYGDDSTMDMDHMYSIYDYVMFNYKYDWQPKTSSNTYAAFAEATVPFGGDRFALTLGGRYEKTKREMDYRLITSMSGMTLSDDSYSVDKTWSSSLGKAALSFKAADNVNFYASVSQGYTPGGFNYTTSVAELADFNETKSFNYELGVKTRLLNNTLMLNANIFHTDYDDLQVLESDVLSSSYVVKNAGKAHTTGFETDIMYRPVKGLDIFATAGLTEAKYDDFEVNSVSYDGNYMIGAPGITATAGATYRHSSGLIGTFDVKQTGKTYFAKDNSDAKIQDAYAIINGKIGYESEKGYEVYLFVRNLTDKKYFTFMRDGGANLAYNYMGEPRTVGMEVNYRF